MANRGPPLLLVVSVVLLAGRPTDGQAGPCEDGAVRLAGGTLDSGRVELCSRGQWQTVCYDGWDVREAEVVCRQLGLSTEHPRALQNFDGETGQVLLDDIFCGGSEAKLEDCEHSGIGNHNCLFSGNAGVLCSDETCTESEYQCAFGVVTGKNEIPCIPEEYVCDGIIDCTLATDENCAGIEPCKTGDVRLVGGLQSHFGILEICFNETWGTVCDDGFGQAGFGKAGANVVCRQLGYQTGVVQRSLFTRGRQYAPIHLDDVTCTGLELELLECPSQPIGVHSCSYDSDVRVACSNESLCLEGDIRLTGVSYREGLLEICLHGFWSSVCDNLWTVEDAKVACRQLGLDTAYVEAQPGLFSFAPSFLGGLQCSGNEESLLDCTHRPLGENTCSSGQQAGLFCDICPPGHFVCPGGSTCIETNRLCNGISDCPGGEDELYNCLSCRNDEDTGNIRLVGSSSLREGELELCVNGRWGTVCDNSFGPEDARVVCRQLGLPSPRAMPQYFVLRQSPTAIWLDHVLCNGFEERLLDCPHNGIGIHDCFHSEDIGVACPPASDPPECNTGELRLQGRLLELCYEGLWSTICQESWDHTDAQVACRQLELPFSGATALYNVSSFAPIALSQLNCTGDEDRLYDCPHPGVGNHSCTPGMVAGLFCGVCSQGEKLCPGTDGDPVCFSDDDVCDTVAQCPNGYDEQNCTCITGHIQLVNNGAVIVSSTTSGSGSGTGSGYEYGTETTTQSRVEGRVEVCYGGQWGTVCDDSWNEPDAEVVCAQLGYRRQGSMAFSNALFGSGTGPIILDDVDCVGHETSLLECSGRLPGEHNCRHTEDASIRCSSCTGDQFECPDSTCLSLDQICDGVAHCLGGEDEHYLVCPPCNDGDVRLVGGSSQYEGRVEYCRNGVWGTVCDDGWFTQNSDVVCRQLGYYEPTRPVCCSSFGEGDPAQEIVLDEVACSGTETTLSQCSSDFTHDCSHREDVGVICTACNSIDEFRCTSGRVDGSDTQCIPVDQVCDDHMDCVGGEDEPYFCNCTTEGDIHLVGGDSPLEGRVEYCSGGEWGTVCDDSWDSIDATVVCRQLGITTTSLVAEARCCAAFGAGHNLQAIHLDNVFCRGSERNLSECSSAARHDCGHGKDAGVICRVCPPDQSLCSEASPNNPVCVTELQFCDGVQNCPKGSDESAELCVIPPECPSPGALRLVSGNRTDTNEGRVEICYGGQWGTICDNLWGTNDAKVACKQLGFGTNGAVAYSRSRHGRGTGPVHLDEVQCIQTHQSLVDCYRNSFGEVRADCADHSKDASVFCPRCVDDDFECVSGRADGIDTPCVSGNQVCDGVVDCVGGEDEPDNCCAYGDVRLVGGSTPFEGRVEYCKIGVWGTVCDHEWGSLDAAVVCRQLGFPSEDAEGVCCGLLGEGDSAQPIYLRTVRCLGSERNLSECTSGSTYFCGHRSDAGVICKVCPPNEFVCSESTADNPVCITELQYCDSVMNCPEGSDEAEEVCVTPPECPYPGALRLVSGNETDTNEGRVEICYGGQWGTVCEDFWDRFDAQVVCRQLGFGVNEAAAYFGSRDGPRTGPVHLTQVRCSGSEHFLVNCSRPHFGEVSGNCRDHSRDASVYCPRCESDEFECESGRVGGSSPCISRDQYCDGVIDCISGEDEPDNCCTPGDVRLVGSSNSFEGRVEYCKDNEWGTVCDDFWDKYEATVVCRQLGHSTQNAQGLCCARYGQGDVNQPIVLDDVRCIGTESSLDECLHGTFLNCGHSEDASVICEPMPVALTLLPVGREDSVFEGGDGTLEVCVEVVSGAISSEIIVGITTSNGTAQAGYDYTEFAANMSLNPGDLLICQTFDVILDDSFLEEPETFTVSVFQIGIRPKATFTQAHNKITIVDDEIGYIGFNQSSYTVEEGDEVMEVCVELLGDERSYVLGKPLSVRLSSDGETAEDGIDFSPTSQIVYFRSGSEPGHTTCVSIPIIDDSSKEDSEAINLQLFICDTAIAMVNDYAIGVIVDNDEAPPSVTPEVRSTSTIYLPTVDAPLSTTITRTSVMHTMDMLRSAAPTPSAGTPLPTPPLPAALEVYFTEDTPLIEGTTVSFVPNTNLPARLSCRLGQDYDCTAGEATVVTGLTPGQTYTLRLVATSDDDRAKAFISVPIPAHSGSCYVHFTNRGIQLLDNGAVLVNFGSAGPVTSYTCSLDRGPEESCAHPYFLTGLSAGRHRLVITPVGILCTDVESLPFTFNLHL